MTAANNKIRRAPNKRPHPSKGVSLSSERVALIKATTPKGKNHLMWAGDNVGYSGVHIWLTKNYGKASKCMFKNTTCSGKSNVFQWANISKEYRRDVNDFIQLCRSCHAKYDYTEKQREITRKKSIGKVPGNIRSIKQYTLDGKFIKEYKAITHAAKELGILRSSISNALAGVSSMAGGYLWR